MEVGGSARAVHHSQADICRAAVGIACAAGAARRIVESEPEFQHWRRRWKQTINPDVVHLHFAREYRGAIRIAAEVAADRQVHDDIKRLIEWSGIRVSDV